MEDIQVCGFPSQHTHCKHSVPRTQTDKPYYCNEPRGIKVVCEFRDYFGHHHKKMGIVIPLKLIK